VRAGFELNWNFVWMKPNFYELPAVVRLASEIGIKQVRVLRLMMNGRAKENRSLLEIPPILELECDQILRTTQTEYREVQLVFSKPLTFQLKNSRYRAAEPCGAARSQLVIEADGSVVPCIGMKGASEFQLGNVRQTSLRNILSTGRSFGISELSQRLHKCPAVMLQSGEPLAINGANLQEEVNP
jgi:radical SAM protein with 4Fe4S-binding SPASM domain